MNTEALLEKIRATYQQIDPNVVAALKAVPRHLFLPDVPYETVYDDIPIYNRTDDEGGFVGGSDQPSQTAMLLTLAELESGHNVLEIGTGPGYSAALIQEIVGERGNVTTLELDKATASDAQDYLRRNRKSEVNVVHVDGAGGYSQRASYDRIISSVAVWDIPKTWVRQVRPRGIIVTPIYLDGLQIMGGFRVGEDGELHAERVYSCSFVPMAGVARPPVQHLYLGGGSALRLYSNEVSRLDSARLHLMMSHDAERCHLGAAPEPRTYWDGFAPYLMMKVPQDYDFVCYAVEGNKLVYGLSGRGFALITIGSVAFVGDHDLGDTHCFSGVDAFLKIDEIFEAWRDAGEPGINRMRVRMMPQPEDEDEGRVFQIEQGYIYRRPDHRLHVYMELGD